jgi:phospholipid/cholesterol/gamma-HCH transport system substrate-binding protein
MSDRKKALAIGGFIVGSFSILATVLLFLKPTFGDSGRTLRVRLVDIEKIGVGTRVTLAGKPIGQVVSIHHIADARLDKKSPQVYAYELILKVDSRMPIYESDHIQPQTSGLLGEKSIAIVPQRAPDHGLVPVQENEVLFAHLNPSVEDTFQRVGRITVKAEETLDILYKMLKEGSGQVQASLNQIQNASSALEKILLQAQEVNLVSTLQETAKETSGAMAKVNKALEGFASESNLKNIEGILAHLESVLGSIDDPTKLKDLLSQAQMAMAQFHRITLKANEAWPKVDTAIDQLANTSQHIEKMAAQSQHAFDHVEKISNHVFEGKGSLGRLLMKDDLYLDINQTVGRVNVLLSDINNYGLLFHNNRTWKNQRVYRMQRLEALKEPASFERYWQEQIQAMQVNMGQLQAMMTQAKRVGKNDLLESDPQFKSALTHVIRSLGDLQQQLSLLTEQWTQPAGHEAETAATTSMP